MTPSPWTSSTIAGIAAVHPRAIAIGPFGSNLTADMYAATGFPVVRGQDIVDVRQLDEGNLVHVPDEVANSMPGSIAREGDLVFPHRGAIGRVGIVGQRPMLLSSSMMKLTCNDSLVIPEFVFYYFRGPGRRELMARASTVGTPGIGQPLKSLRGIPIHFPMIAEQKAIAAMLGALDDKIAANRDLAVVADEFVRARFAALALRANSSVTISQLAEHPRDLIDPSVLEANLPYVGLEHVPRRRMWLESVGRASDVTSTKAAYSPGDVLFGKLRPYFHKVAAASTAGVCSTDILVLRPKDKELTGFLLAAASSDETVERCTAASGGTRMPRTSWKDLASVSVPWPGDAEAIQFGAGVDGLRMRIDAAVVENDILGRARDALLPELMSGRIRVRDAERAVEQAI